jgi:hypothetical protein
MSRNTAFTTEELAEGIIKLYEALGEAPTSSDDFQAVDSAPSSAAFHTHCRSFAAFRDGVLARYDKDYEVPRGPGHKTYEFPGLGDYTDEELRDWVIAWYTTNGEQPTADDFEQNELTPNPVVYEMQVCNNFDSYVRRTVAEFTTAVVEDTEVSNDIMGGAVE